MYQVYAINHEETAEFIENFIEKQYAWNTFMNVCSAVDCHFAMITNGLTGEVLVEWSEGCMTIHDKDGSWEDFLFE